MSLTLRPSGERAVLVEVPDLPAALTLHAWLRSAVARDAPPWSSVVDLVPAARSVLIVADAAPALAQIESALGELSVGRGEAEGQHAGATRTHHIEVRYDGPDLDDVARLTGLTMAEVVAAHTDSTWTVAFAGFAPGFAYLTGGDPRLRVPRRSDPRPLVPAGAVGLAGEFSGVYPIASPGGWQLLGTTTATLWDLANDPPALLRPGDRVRFSAMEGSA